MRLQRIGAGTTGSDEGNSHIASGNSVPTLRRSARRGNSESNTVKVKGTEGGRLEKGWLYECRRFNSSNRYRLQGEHDPADGSSLNLALGGVPASLPFPSCLSLSAIVANASLLLALFG